MKVASPKKDPQVEVANSRRVLFNCTIHSPAPFSSSPSPPLKPRQDLESLLKNLQKEVLELGGIPNHLQGNSHVFTFNNPVRALEVAVEMLSKKSVWGMDSGYPDTLRIVVGLDMETLAGRLPEKSGFSRVISKEDLLRSKQLCDLALEWGVGCLSTGPVLGQDALEPKLFPGMAPAQFSARLAGYKSLSQDLQMDSIFEVFQGDTPDLETYKKASRRMLTHTINLVLKGAYSDAFQVLLTLQKAHGHRAQADPLFKYYLSLSRRALEYP